MNGDIHGYTLIAMAMLFMVFVLGALGGYIIGRWSRR